MVLVFEVWWRMSRVSWLFWWRRVVKEGLVRRVGRWKVMVARVRVFIFVLGADFSLVVLVVDFSLVVV